MPRTWVDDSAPYLNAQTLNGLEAELAAALRVNHIEGTATKAIASGNFLAVDAFGTPDAAKSRNSEIFTLQASTGRVLTSQAGAYAITWHTWGWPSGAGERWINISRFDAAANSNPTVARTIFNSGWEGTATANVWLNAGDGFTLQAAWFGNTTISMTGKYFITKLR